MLTKYLKKRKKDFANFLRVRKCNLDKPQTAFDRKHPVKMCQQNQVMVKCASLRLLTIKATQNNK